MVRAYTQYRTFIGSTEELNSELLRMQQEDKIEIRSVLKSDHIGEGLFRYDILFHITIETDELVKAIVAEE